MARIFMAGAEVDAAVAPAHETVGLLDGRVIGSGIVSRDTTVFRSGLASWKCDSTGSNLSATVEITSPTYVDGRTYFFRSYVRAAAAPATVMNIFAAGSVTGTPLVEFRTDGALQLNVSNVVRGSPSAVVTDSTWHRVELSVAATATGNWGSAELRLDGATVATWSGTQVRGGNLFQMGWIGPGAGASLVLNVDDAALNDSTGSVNNSWCGAGAVVLLKPTADSAVGTGWTLGTGTAISGGTGKTAVANTRPLGVADLAAGSDPKQIRNATSNANVNYDATMTTYTAAGVGASDTVNAVQCWAATAAPVTTSAKLGTVGIVSNPTVANVSLGATGTAGAFWAGSLAGTYGAGWKWSPGTMAETPTVTKGTAPVMRITQVTASTRIAVVCGMFIYVDYSPPSANVYTKTGYAKESG